MTGDGTRPWEDKFSVLQTEIVVETPELRAVRLTLGPGDEVPWHYHNNIDDRFICLEGAIEIETRNPSEKFHLRPGQEAMVAATIPHIVRNAYTDKTSFMVLQGVGIYDYVDAD